MEAKNRNKQEGATDKNSLSRLGEFGLIRLLTQRAAGTLTDGVIGAGDDCAVIPLSAFGWGEGYLLLSSDLMVEDRHFRTSYTSPEDIGWKLVAVNASDIAAMGGTPIAVVINLQTPVNRTPEFLERVYAGIYEHALALGINVVGGDTSSGSELALGMAILGKSAVPPVLRSGAKVGDSVYLSAPCGAASLGFRALEGQDLSFLSREQKNQVVQRFLRPEPRVSLGHYLLENKIASAMIDISDGVLQDAGHVALASNVAFELDAEAITEFKDTIALGAALQGGEDYELLFTAAPALRARQAGYLNGAAPPIEIGKVVAPDHALSSGSVMLREKGGEPVPYVEFLRKRGIPAQTGYNHF